MGARKKNCLQKRGMCSLYISSSSFSTPFCISAFLSIDLLFPGFGRHHRSLPALPSDFTAAGIKIASSTCFCACVCVGENGTHEKLQLEPTEKRLRTALTPTAHRGIRFLRFETKITKTQNIHPHTEHMPFRQRNLLKAVPTHTAQVV